MSKFTYENQGMDTNLVYEIDADAEIDTLSLGMITNNTIDGVMPIVFCQMNLNRYFKYNVSSKINLEQYFAGMINRKKLLTVCYSLTNAIIHAEEYMINTRAFLMDSQKIFVNVSTGEAQLVNIPVMNQEQSVDIYTFIKNIVFNVQCDQNENCDYIGRILSFLNSNKNKSVIELNKFIANLMTESSADKRQEAKEEDNLRDARYDYEMNDMHQSNEADVSGFPSTPSPLPDDEKKEGFIAKLLHKKKREEDDILIPNQEPVKMQNVKEEYIPETDNNVMVNNNVIPEVIPEQIIVPPSDYDATTMIQSKTSVKTKNPRIVRTKTGESISINKKVFRIGKESTFADYCIRDNQAISRSHAEIIIENGKYYILDTNSKNHIFLDGDKINANEKVELTEGVKVTLADEDFEFHEF